MKEGWEYKKLGEVGQIITGSTPSTKDVDNYSSNDYCFIKPSDIEAEGISKLYNSEFYISNKAFQNSRKLPVGAVLTTCIGIIGKVGILQINATCNQQINAIIPQNIIKSKFLAYAIKGSGVYLNQIANAPVVPIINKKAFSEVIIPVPPLSEQKRIVEELDLLSGIIEKQKQQLKELDTLAQSIFYDMFGDPVTNEKGWEVKKMGDIGTFQRGGGFLKKDFVDYGVPCIHYGQIHTKFGPFSKKNLSYISQETAQKSKFAFPRDIIIAITSEDVEGSCKSVAWLGNEKVAVGGHSAIFSHNQNPIFIAYYMRTNAFSAEKAVYAHGFKVVEIKPTEIAKINIFLPPLHLQDIFEESIINIEKEKEDITKSMEETQKLFDYTMDKYFG